MWYAAASYLLQAGSKRERDFIGVQVPLNKIKVAILVARWKEEEQTSTTTFVAISELVILMVILVW